MFLRHLIRGLSVDIQVKFYGDRPRGEPIAVGGPGELNTRELAEYSDFGPIERISETVQDRIELGLVLITNRKSYHSHVSFRLVPNSVTLNDLERCNGRYIVLFQRI